MRSRSAPENATVAALILMSMLALCLGAVVLDGLRLTFDEGWAALAGRPGTIRVESCSSSRPGFECSGPFTPVGDGPVVPNVEVYLGDKVAPGTTVEVKLGPLGGSAVVAGGIGRSWIWALLTACFGWLAVYCGRWVWWYARPRRRADQE
jgi:hypothetical protein